MKLYEQYRDTKSYDDDFLRWLLIRKLNLKQQLAIIFVLWMVWIILAPNLVFWVTFFKYAIIISLITALIVFIKKRLKLLS
ncbi:MULTISPECIES: hypothetical protein [Vagococcus]|uniref:Uncharacterized protein n=1 Tax=Vagococcus teuberi TaxID=519472 RepID=A0A1J0A7Z6_9ENTE|nr:MULTISPECIES: hypothetical protein [Vagococcus]APB32068.1 hypothetical protein BHY08_09760 [Vagococcus teuberi]RHH70212.1 hypothetical protein DW196_05460 [Vagococcus sp. AM17-17]